MGVNDHLNREELLQNMTAMDGILPRPIGPKGRDLVACEGFDNRGALQRDPLVDLARDAPRKKKTAAVHVAEDDQRRRFAWTEALL
jgi:hypothetical protein